MLLAHLSASNILCLCVFAYGMFILFFFFFPQNASLQTESSLLKEQLKQIENQNTSLNNQMLALQRHTTALQEQNSALHTQTAKQQVNNETGLKATPCNSFFFFFPAF